MSPVEFFVLIGVVAAIVYLAAELIRGAHQTTGGDSKETLMRRFDCEGMKLLAVRDIHANELLRAKASAIRTGAMDRLIQICADDADARSELLTLLALGRAYILKCEEERALASIRQAYRIDPIRTKRFWKRREFHSIRKTHQVPFTAHRD